MSRSTLFQLEHLKEEHVLLALQRALADEERGLGGLRAEAEEEALLHIAAMAHGDIRRALGALELAVLTTPPDADGTVRVTLEAAEESIRRPTVKADESTQYDVLSAFHKSVRGSSDAALFWFLYAVEKLGMDPMVFLRRLIVACSEDIGLANPQAMVQAVSAHEAYREHRLAGGQIQHCPSDPVRGGKPEIERRGRGHRKEHGGHRAGSAGRGAAASAGRPLRRAESSGMSVTNTPMTIRAIMWSNNICPMN